MSEPAVISFPAKPQAAAPIPRAGEFNLTPGQKVALLKMQRSDWSKAVLAELKQAGKDLVTGADFFALANMGLAVKPYITAPYHRLTQHGHFRADQVAIELGRELKMHVITYFLGAPGRAAKAQCLCGWRAFRTRAIPSYVTMLAKDAAHHRAHIGAKAATPADEALAQISRIMAEDA